MMGLVTLLPMLLAAAPTIFQLGSDAIAGYRKIVAAAKIKVGTPEEQLLLTLIETRMHELDKEVAEAPEPA